jgi:hypothetical protein
MCDISELKLCFIYLISDTFYVNYFNIPADLLKS